MPGGNSNSVLDGEDVLKRHTSLLIPEDREDLKKDFSPNQKRKGKPLDFDICWCL